MGMVGRIHSGRPLSASYSLRSRDVRAHYTPETRKAVAEGSSKNLCSN